VSQLRATPDVRRHGILVALVVAAVGIVVLFVLIGRELFGARRAVAAGGVRGEPAAVAPAEIPVAPASPPVLAAIAHPFAAPTLAPPVPVAAPSDSAAAPVASAPLAPPAARAIASVIANPRSTRPSNVLQHAQNHTETYAYERLLPFQAADLTRDKTNPKSWVMNLARGPEVDDLAPRGGLHEAFVQKDDQGDPFGTWYTIDTGPLAPAYVIKRGDLTRVISRPYLEANRADFPPSVTSNLDR
jgi:hypothetical protein